MRTKFIHTILFIVSVVLMTQTARASHIMGGSITYECLGNGNYVFELVFYRDCNGAHVNTVSQNLRVWNHPTLSNITLPYVSTEDISPQGTTVNGTAACFDCATNGNLGIGSIERVVYRSAPTNISGVPPTQGWVFTFDDFSRNGNITNLQNPLNFGITLSAKIFNVNYQTNVCNDHSPKFLQNPHFVSCVGKPFKLNLNPVDPDLDSISIHFDTPLNNLNNQPYVEGTNPLAVPFANGFSTNNPTPTVAMMAGNQNAQIDPLSGEITFLSFIAGNFNVKLKVVSFRNGQKISEVVHEMQLIVTHCTSNNQPPIIAPLYGGTFTTTVAAGSLVNFNFSSSDPETLFNGQPQTNTIHPTGLLFGPDPTLAAGCLIAPCPTINPGEPITGTQGANVQFNWQTSCAHLIDANGNEQDMVPYQFVFRVADDNCPIPEVVYETVTVNITNPGVIQAPAIKCIQGSGTNTFTLQWDAVSNPTGSFVAYQINTVQNGLIATINNLSTTSYTHVGVTDDLDYYLTVVSGCAGTAFRHSDTIKNIYLNLSNLNPGVAVLDWNKPTNPAQGGMNGYYYIQREYPTGVWTIIDSVPYNTTHYEDIIDICSAQLNYQIRLKNTPCDYTSQINGAIFTDQTPPSIPVMQSVSIDTLTGETIIVWQPSPEPDTKGYIIYKQDPVTGFLVEVDTVYGRLNTNYDYLEGYKDGSMTYTVAAFDSCPSPTGAPFNLSARDPNFHSTVFLKNQYSICDAKIRLTWSAYKGWPVTDYSVFISENNGPWQLVQTTSNLYYEFTGQDLVLYRIAIRANKGDGIVSYSLLNAFTVNGLVRPTVNYIEYATVKNNENQVEVSYRFDANVIISKIALQRLKGSQFETIEEVVNPTSPHVFTDSDVRIHEESYTYRVIYYDSCGNEGLPSNIGKTILLTTKIDNTSLQTYIYWTPYEDFNGDVERYELFKTIDLTSNPSSLGYVQPNILSLEEDLYAIETEGRICYRVVAWEGANIYGQKQKSVSNDACVTIEPLIYVPNTFTPNSDVLNELFKPVLRNYKLNSYKFTIINRWGMVTYKSTDPNEGWNGTIHNDGKEAENGTYLYVVEVEDANGVQLVKRGHVNLIR